MHNLNIGTKYYIKSFKDLKHILKTAPQSSVVVFGVKTQWLLAVVVKPSMPLNYAQDSTIFTNYLLATTRNPYEPKRHKTVTAAINVAKQLEFTNVGVCTLPNADLLKYIQVEIH